MRTSSAHAQTHIREEKNSTKTTQKFLSNSKFSHKNKKIYLLKKKKKKKKRVILYKSNFFLNFFCIRSKKIYQNDIKKIPNFLKFLKEEDEEEKNSK